MTNLINSPAVDDLNDEDGNPSGSENKRSANKSCDVFSNSRMSFGKYFVLKLGIVILFYKRFVYLGRRSKPKRQFIQPALRQAIPVNSAYVEEIDDCHWRCRICKGNILAAVISAGAIRHYRIQHPNQLQNMQYELCKVN